MKNFNTKIGAIQADNTSAYVEVSEGSEGAVIANNGKYYATKETIESSYPDGDYEIVYLHESVFAPIQEILPKNKREWELQEAEPAVRAFIEGKIREMPYDYFSINEVNTWLGDAEFGAQAAAVAEWIKECWKHVRTTVDSADINDLPTIEDIINGLPELYRY